MPSFDHLSHGGLRPATPHKKLLTFSHYISASKIPAPYISIIKNILEKYIFLLKLDSPAKN
jgi:hypothetical protein